jgi:hypothetical protein
LWYKGKGKGVAPHPIAMPKPKHNNLLTQRFFSHLSFAHLIFRYMQKRTQLLLTAALPGNFTRKRPNPC